MGYGNFVFESEQEPAILALKEAVTTRIIAIKGDGVQILPVVSRVGESQNNGDVHGQFRTLRASIRANYQKHINEDAKSLA